MIHVRRQSLVMLDPKTFCFFALRSVGDYQQPGRLGHCGRRGLCRLPAGRLLRFLAR
jgi:hypothetical protein